MSVVTETDEQAYFAWNGMKKDLPFFTLKAHRDCYDLFQNTSCRAISTSKISGNTNVVMLFPGPIMIYSSKYVVKSNQKDERRDFGQVVRATQKMLHDGRKYDGDRSEAMRMLLRATFQHNTENVVGAPMAAYLTRNGSRFYFSHDFAWCPLEDMVETLYGRETKGRVKMMGRMRIIEKPCYDYLCRGDDMEDMCFFDMVKEYERVFVKKDSTNVEPFRNQPEYEHPSFVDDVMRQGLKLRDEEVLVKIPQRVFPDAGQFKGNILDSNTPINDSMEVYSLLVLTLFYPFRTLSDLNDNGTVQFTMKLRQVYQSRSLMPRFDRFLQNIQDSAHNYLRHEIKDELEGMTTTFKPDKDVMKNDDVEEEEELSNLVLGNELFEELEEEQLDDSQINVFPEISFRKILRRGRERMPKDDEICEHEFISVEERGGHSPDFIISNDDPDVTMNGNDSGEQESNAPPESPRKRAIHRLHAVRRNTTKKVPTKKRPITVMVANGTAESVVDWAEKTGLDLRQRKAFVTILCRFLLTFYTSVSNPASDPLSRGAQVQYNRERKRLNDVIKLGTGEELKQLIMFMHGPGGSGKSAVIDLVTCYAEDFCKEVDYPFTENTIVKTAVSGVAATLIGGRTVHSKCALFRKLSGEDLAVFKEARLLVVDEVSFASAGEMRSVDQKLRAMTTREDEKFGGLDIVFAGDFRQLEPVKKDSMYKTRSDEFEWQNCYVELDGTHRFRDDPEWGRLLSKFRDGTVTVEDVRYINENCMVKEGRPIPDGIQYAAFSNRTRDVVNTLAFEKYCATHHNTEDVAEDAIIILSDSLFRKSADKTWEPLKNRKYFYENLGEDDIKPGKFKPRLDPVLKLFRDCPLMMTHNEDVNENKANGTSVTLEQVVLKPGEEAFLTTLDNGIQVKCVFASQVESLELRHVRKDVEKKVFSLKSEDHQVSAKWPMPVNLQVSGKAREMFPMKIHQFAVVRNSCTTGHKLQGKTVLSIFAYDLNYMQNWTYVVLSRVTKMAGVYLRIPLTEDIRKFSVPIEYRYMMDRLRENEGVYPCLDEYMRVAEN